MTDEEYAAEWPFSISQEEIELMRTPTHILRDYHVTQKSYLIQLRNCVELWLGYFNDPTTIRSRVRQLIWYVAGRRIYEAVRPLALPPKRKSKKKDNP